jgi:hypothetical protein
MAKREPRPQQLIDWGGRSSFCHAGLLGVFLLLGTMPGCDHPRPITGGTKSVVVHAGHPVEDVEVQVFRRADKLYECIARGVSGPNGRFELIDPFGMGPVILTNGQYNVTVASASPIPMEFPQEYSSPETSPLETNWSVDQGELVIEVPLPQPAK